MKILEIIHGLPSGGAERFVVDLSNELVKANEVELLTLKDDTRNGMGFYLSDLSTEVRYHNMKFQDSFHFRYLWEVYKYIRKSKPDIVHIHIVAEYCFLPLLLMCRNIKFFQTVHIDIAKAFKGVKRKIILYTFGLFHKLEYVTISRTNYADMCSKYGFCRNTLIYNGRAPMVKTDSFLHVQAEVNSLKNNRSTKVFLHIARCDHQKNQELLIRSFNGIVSKGANAILLVIGAGFHETNLGRYLMEIACSSVFFLGTRNNVEDYYYCSDVFCLSSLYEGMPITAIEAILCRIPVISTPVCGVVDVIENGKNGLIADDFSEEAYEKCMMACLENKDGFSELRYSCIDLSIANCATNYLKLFENR